MGLSRNKLIYCVCVCGGGPVGNAGRRATEASSKGVKYFSQVGTFRDGRDPKKQLSPGSLPYRIRDSAECVLGRITVAPPPKKDQLWDPWKGTEQSTKDVIKGL